MTPDMQAGYAKAKQEALSLLDKIGAESTVDLLTRENRELTSDRLATLQRDIGKLLAHNELGLESVRAQLVKFSKELRLMAGTLDCAAAKAEVEAKRK